MVPSTLVYKAQRRAWSLEETWEATWMEARCRLTHAWPGLVSCSHRSVAQGSLQSSVPGSPFPTSFVKVRE